MDKKQIDKIELHLKSILEDCMGDEQITHDVHEIREHLRNKDYI